MSFSQSFVVVPGDVDEQGHVNNVTYVRWIQNVAVAHWSSVTNPEIRGDFSWIVTRHEIDYRKPCFSGDEIMIETWVGRPGRATWERFTEIRCNDVILAEARSVWCLVKRSNMRPARITDDIKRRLSEDTRG